MDFKDKTKAVEYLVLEVFIKAHNKKFLEFVQEYDDSIRKSIKLSMELNAPVVLPPTNFDLREPTEQLIKNLSNFEILHKDKQ